MPRLWAAMGAVAQTMNKQAMKDGEKQLETVSSSAKASSHNIPRDLRSGEEDLAFSVDYFGASTHPPSHN
ncbi:hypothetical protein HPP92_014479 [Vanilla planifolia]|uniref:Uncharacterized protein n=1 Tax=Vanilla planifolia TaxID=51239 RepID=A0A835QPM1_VANPL|nr:hypothetical protein HPP92_014479 [Vanilla planifolia]